MKCMYTSACGDTVDCSEFKWCIYSDILVWYLHMNLLAHVWHLRVIFIVGTYVAIGWWIRVANYCFILLIYAVISGSYPYYSSSETHMYMCVHICSGAYANNSRHIYWHKSVICGHELIGMWVLYVAFGGHISFCHVHDNNMMLIVPSMTSLRLICWDVGLEELYDLSCWW